MGKKFSCCSDQKKVTLTVEWLLVTDRVVWVSQKQSLEFAENGAKRQKTSSEQRLCGQKRIINERGQRRGARVVEADRKVTVTQISAHYNSGMQKSISEHTMCQASKWIGYGSRKPIRLKNKSNKHIIMCSLGICTEHRDRAMTKDVIALLLINFRYSFLLLRSRRLTMVWVNVFLISLLHWTGVEHVSRQKFLSPFSTTLPATMQFLRRFPLPRCSLARPAGVLAQRSGRKSRCGRERSSLT